MADTRRLPAPVTALWDWQLRAACREVDTEVFFHPERERGPGKRARDSRAKRLCAGCPVIEACRGYALSVGEPYGVWGGLTADERSAILRRPLPGATRPRHLDVPHRVDTAVRAGGGPCTVGPGESHS